MFRAPETMHGRCLRSVSTSGQEQGFVIQSPGAIENNAFLASYLERFANVAQVVCQIRV